MAERYGARAEIMTTKYAKSVQSTDFWKDWMENHFNSRTTTCPAERIAASDELFDKFFFHCRDSKIVRIEGPFMRIELLDVIDHRRLFDPIWKTF